MNEKPKILFVTFNNISSQDYGGAQCTVRNLDALKGLYEVECYQIKKKSNVASLYSLLTGFFPPCSKTNCDEIIYLIERERYACIFLDSSLFGVLAGKIKKKFNVPVVVYFHNIEFNYTSVRFKKYSLLKWLYKISSWYSEKKILEVSDVAITLHERDQDGLLSLYGCTSSCNIPISFSCKLSDKELDLKYQAIITKPQDKKERVCLFVGAFGEANYQGIKWFAKSVAPYIKAKTLIVGKGFEVVASELKSKNVQVLGFVDDLEELYIQADCVISPLLFGGGMKVKVAEALMYGKTVFGTSESYAGYEMNYRIGVVCDTSEQFILAINNFMLDLKKYNVYSRNVFKEKYCSEIVNVTIQDVISNTISEQSGY